MKKLIPAIILACLVFASCQNGNNEHDAETGMPEQAAVVQESAMYIEDPLSVPHDTVFYEDTFEDSLYYIAAENERAVLARINSKSPENTDVFPLGIASDNHLFFLDVDTQGQAHILALQCDMTASQWVFGEASWRIVSDNGTVSPAVILNESVNDWPAGFRVDANGNAYIAVLNEVIAFRPDGGMAFSVSCGDFVRRLFGGAEGEVYVSYYQDNMQMLSQLNFAATAKDRDYDIAYLGTLIGFVGNSDGKSFAANESGIYDVELNTKSFDERLSFASSFIVINTYDNLLPLANGHILRSAKDEFTHAAGVLAAFSVIRPRTAEEAADAEARSAEQENVQGIGDITVGLFGFNQLYLTRAILDFNKLHPESQIEIREYAFDINEGIEPLLNQFRNDFISSDLPDVLLMDSPSGSDFWSYALQGAYKDLGAYFDSDLGFDISDYQENILRAAEQDGKLYGVPITFNIDCLMGRESDLGDTIEWNLDEFIAFADRFPDNSVFRIPTKQRVLQMLLEANCEALVDWTSIDAGFQRDTFIKMIEFANRFESMPPQKPNTQERIGSGDIRLFQWTINEMSTDIRFAFELFGEPVRFVGYPSEEGSGFIIQTTAFAAISSNCKNERTAWEFLRFLLSDEVQASPLGRGNFPVKRSCLEAQIEKDRSKDGEASNTLTEMSLSIGDEEMSALIVTRPLLDEELEPFLDVLNSADRIYLGDRHVNRIVWEETEAYFSGVKSAAEVTDIVENRVGIYMKEMR